MAASPLLDSDGVVRLSVTSGGSAVGDDVRIHSVEVRRAIGAIPSALLVIDDGDMPTGGWPIADAATFAPGAVIAIKAGYGDDEESIFEGIVVRMQVRISGDNASRLHVHCQDKAVKMTVGRRNANYIDKTDSDIIADLIGKQGLTADVDATSAQHGALVQYYCTDWDFMMARAEVNGLLVIADAGTVKVAAPAASAAADLTVTWGQDLVDFNAEIDARGQYSQVAAVAWDPKNQAVVEASAGPATLNAQGNLTSATLAAVLDAGDFTLQSATSLDRDLLQAWAKGQQQKAGLARIRGRMRFQGSARAKVGGIIEVAGVGDRYNGQVFVGGLVQEIADGEWTTSIDFGLPGDWFSARADVVAPPAAGWIPGAAGLQTGIVSKLDDDPAGEQRIGIKVPVLKAETEMIWARLLQYYASNSFGAFYLPEVGDEVVLGYFNDDPSNPVILGSLYSSKRPPPYPLAAENKIKALVTRSKARIEINDDDVVVTLSTPANNQIVISDKDKSILLKDEHGNSIEMNASGITLTSPGDIKLSAKGNISADAGLAMALSAKSDLSAKGLNVTAEAQVALTAKGAASAELSASGQTVVRGAMVMIN